MKSHLTIEEAISKIKNEKGAVVTELMRRGTMQVEFYAPKKTDPQQPNNKDEIYVIASGHTTLYREGQRIMYFTGDVLFIAAGIDHRFENFSDDFTSWIIFYNQEEVDRKSGKLP